MVGNIVEMVTNELRGAVADRIGTAVGLSGSQIQSGLSNAIPAVVGGLVNKGATPAGASELLNLMQQHQFDGSQAPGLATTAADPNGISRLVQLGMPLLPSIFGSRAEPVVDWLAAKGGINKSSSLSLLGLAIPLVLGWLGHRVNADGWSVSSLQNVLGGLRGQMGGLPAGLSNILGSGAPDRDE